MIWKKYYELEPIRRLKNEGRELLGEYVVFTEKRDGENVSLTLEAVQPDSFEFKIHSHNLDVASPDIAKRFMDTPEFDKACLLLNDEAADYDNHYILYGELMKKVCPTRIEPNKKHCHWVLFDIYDLVAERYLSYESIYQKAYHYKIPIVRMLTAFVPNSLENLELEVNVWLSWCRKHRREGIVGKSYRNQVFFKEKIDLPKKVKLVKPDKIQYPSMPEEKIIRALQHAYDIVGEANWNNTSKAMPEIAKQLSNEAREHLYASPHNMFQIYKETPLEKIRPVKLNPEDEEIYK